MTAYSAASYGQRNDSATESTVGERHRHAPAMGAETKHAGLDCRPSEAIGARPLEDRKRPNGRIACRRPQPIAQPIDDSADDAVASNVAAVEMTDSSASVGTESSGHEADGRGKVNEDRKSSPPNGTPGGKSIPFTDELVPENKFRFPVDADHYAQLIPGNSDPVGDRILAYRLGQKNQYIADVDPRGWLLSNRREFHVAKTNHLPILLRVQRFRSEAETREFVYQCHDGGLNYKPKDLRRMRHARVMNLLTIPGMFPAEIARRTGMDESTIRKIHNRNNPGLKRGDGRRLSADKEAHIRQLGEEKIKHTKIAALTGVSKATVSRILKPAPKKVAPKPVTPERTPAADHLVGEPAKAASDMMGVTSAALPEAVEGDASTPSACAKAGIGVEFSLDEVAALDERVVDDWQDLVNGVDSEDLLSLLAMESEFCKRKKIYLDQKILELRDEVLEDASHPDTDKYSVGSELVGTVKAVEPDGVLVGLPDCDGVIDKRDDGLTWEGVPEEGDEVHVRVKGFDSASGLVQLELVAIDSRDEKITRQPVRDDRCSLKPMRSDSKKKRTSVRKRL